MSYYKFLKNIPKNGFLILIKIYQKTLSFDHGWLKIFKPYGACKFYPTCSAYTYLAVKKFGLAKGGLAGLKRLKKCHPWSNGGYESFR